VIVCFKQFLGNYKCWTHFWATLSQSEGYALILAKNGLGYNLGEFSQIHLVTLLESEEGRGIVNTFNVLDSVGKLTSKLLQFWIRQHCALLTQKKHTIDY
jgi:hypothetical protein